MLQVLRPGTFLVTGSGLRRRSAQVAYSHPLRAIGFAELKPTYPAIAVGDVCNHFGIAFAYLSMDNVSTRRSTVQTRSTYTLDDVIQRIEDEQTWWAESTHNADVTEAEAPGFAGEWSFKDLVNHLNIWQGRDIAELKSARDGTPRPGPEWPVELESIENEDEKIERINAWTSKRDKDIPLNEAVARYDAQLEELKDFVVEMTDETINDDTYFPVLGGVSLAEAIIGNSFFDHTHGEHGQDMQKWNTNRAVENPTI